MSRKLAGALALGSLLITGVLPAAAALRAPLPALTADVKIAPDVQLAAVDSNERREYTARLREEMREWRQKMHDIGDRAEMKAHKVSRATRKQLDAAWSRTQAEARHLERATSRGWDKAKDAYERAKDNLRTAWNNTFPND